MMLKQEAVVINRNNFGRKVCEEADGLWDRRVKACVLSSVQFIAELRDGVVKLWEAEYEDMPSKNIIVKDVSHLYAYDLREDMGHRLNADFDPKWPSIYGKLNGSTLAIFQHGDKLAIRIPGD